MHFFHIDKLIVANILFLRIFRKVIAFHLLIFFCRQVFIYPVIVSGFSEFQPVLHQ